MWYLKSGQWIFHLYIWENLTKYIVMMMKKKIFLTLWTPWKALGTPQKSLDCGLRAMSTALNWSLVLDQCHPFLWWPAGGGMQTAANWPPQRPSPRPWPQRSLPGDPGTHSPLPATLRERPRRAIRGAPWGDPRLDPVLGGLSVPPPI